MKIVHKLQSEKLTEKEANNLKSELKLLIEKRKHLAWKVKKLVNEFVEKNKRGEEIKKMMENLKSDTSDIAK